MGIYEKLYNVMVDVRRIPKEGRNQTAQYDYATEKAIKEVLHNALVKNKLLFQFEVTDIDIKDMQPNKDGRPVSITVIKTRYAFIDIENGNKHEGVFAGSGNGRDDKGVYAAMTGAIKYILTSNFLIPTGDDPEDDRYEIKERKSENEVEKKPEVPANDASESDSKETPDDKTGQAGDEGSNAGEGKDAPAEAQASTVKLNEDQCNVIIAAFDRQGVEIWDLEKTEGDHRTWTTESRRNMLRKYNALEAKNNPYSKEDFLAGKDVPR